MPEDQTIAHVVQLSVAPVFLLSGIATLLNVLTNRLARIVDRARGMEAQFPVAAPGRADVLRISLRRLAKRARLASYAISLCTTSAILVSAVVITLFLGNIFAWNVRVAVAVLFIISMLGLTAGLGCFLREIYLSTRYLRIGAPEPAHATPPPQAVKTAAGQPD